MKSNWLWYLFIFICPVGLIVAVLSGGEYTVMTAPDAGSMVSNDTVREDSVWCRGINFLNQSEVDIFLEQFGGTCSVALDAGVPPDVEQAEKRNIR